MEAEKSVLGSMLISPEAVSLACELDPQDFILPAHIELFGTMKDMFKRGVRVDAVTVVSELRDRIQDAGGVRYVMELALFVPSAANVEFYIKAVRDKRQRREFLAGMQQARETAIDGGDYITEAQQVIDGVVKLGGHEVRPVGQEALEAVLNLGKATRGMDTGFIKLDAGLGGLKDGELVIIGGRPSMGKTSFAMNIALKAAEKERVAVFSLEMSAESLLQRAAISLASVNQYEAQQDEKAMQELLDAAEKITQYQLYVDDKGGVSVDYIRAQCHKIKPRLVVVDYIGLMRTNQRKNGTREQEIAELTRGMKLLAKDMRCPVLLLSQLNRGLELRKDKMPVLSDLRESGAIEQDADVVMFLYRPWVYNNNLDPKEAILSVAKNRNGKTGEIDLKWDGAHFLYTDPDMQEYYGDSPFEEDA